MKLTLGERLHLLNILPQTGNLVTLKVIMQLRDDLAPGEEEGKKLDMVQEGTTVTWDEKKDAGKEFDMTPARLEVITRALKDLEKDSKLTIQLVPLYERFIE